MIIDEEQRFGVEHKDTLKKLKTNVDILAMSATPIPRTLEMAVTGIREMSTLQTPPEDRHPILTFVGPRNDKQIAAAIRRELLREGQVFFVHNRVQSIHRVAAQLAELVPEARIAVAHGQMGEHVLEQVVDDFWERSVRRARLARRSSRPASTSRTRTRSSSTAPTSTACRSCTSCAVASAAAASAPTPTSSTTRTSRSPRPRTTGSRRSPPTTTSAAACRSRSRTSRSAARATCSAREQAGHIAGVGFDLYLRMIGEAVSTFRGDDAEGQTELRLELPVDAHIPEEYIDSERLRLEAYQKLSAAASATAKDDAIDLVLDELTDRYGEPPAEVEGLARRLAAAPPCRPGRARRRRRDGTEPAHRAGEPPRLDAGAAAAPVPGREAAVGRRGDRRADAAAGDERVSDADLIAWVRQLLDQLFPAPVAPPVEATPTM